MNGEQLRFDFIPTSLAVKAMRDNGYKNAAYAIAELFDNSLQAGAKAVELLCVETEEQLAQRRRRRIKNVAVLDNGIGMNSEVLRMALQFGNGTHLNDRTGIGRFGMGLPNASISQCRRLDVWSWQSGFQSPLYTYLDLDEIERGELQEVPEPIVKPIPSFWRQAGETFDSTGTLVVWSDLDRCVWKTAKTIVTNSEFIVARMYRNFIDSGKATIRLATFLGNNPHATSDEFSKANDPIYLMQHSSTPPPFSDRAMFEKYGDSSRDEWEVKPKIQFNDEVHEVAIRFTVASEEARKPSETGQVAGNLPHGKHAAKNVGISIVRADRELELDQSWVHVSEARERWWGVEIAFPPALDDVFGVTNNKQSARYFSQTPDIEALLDEGQTITQLKGELRELDDPRGPLIDIAETIRRNLRQIRRLIENQQRSEERKGSRRRHAAYSPEVQGTRKVQERQNEGYKGKSDAEESNAKEDRIEAIKNELIEQGTFPRTAEEVAAHTVSDGIKFVFSKSDLETSAFFSVRPRGGALIITLNTSHPAHKHLIDLLDTPDPQSLSSEELAERLTNAWQGLQLLLEAWARYEDEQPEGPRRNRAQDVRNDWGRVARYFLDRDFGNGKV